MSRDDGRALEEQALKVVRQVTIELRSLPTEHVVKRNQLATKLDNAHSALLSLRSSSRGANGMMFSGLAASVPAACFPQWEVAP